MEIGYGLEGYEMSTRKQVRLEVCGAQKCTAEQCGEKCECPSEHGGIIVRIRSLWERSNTY